MIKYNIRKWGNYQERPNLRTSLLKIGVIINVNFSLKRNFRISLVIVLKNVGSVPRGVYLVDRGGFGQVSFDSVEFQIGYFSD